MPIQLQHPRPIMRPVSPPANLPIHNLHILQPQHQAAPQPKLQILVPQQLPHQPVHFVPQPLFKGLEPPRPSETGPDRKRRPRRRPHRPGRRPLKIREPTKVIESSNPASDSLPVDDEVAIKENFAASLKDPGVAQILEEPVELEEPDELGQLENAKEPELLEEETEAIQENGEREITPEENASTIDDDEPTQQAEDVGPEEPQTERAVVADEPESFEPEQAADQAEDPDSEQGAGDMGEQAVTDEQLRQPSSDKQGDQSVEEQSEKPTQQEERAPSKLKGGRFRIKKITERKLIKKTTASTSPDKANPKK